MSSEENQINLLSTTETEVFKVGTNNLSAFHNRLVKITNGALLYCIEGEAEIIINLQKYHITPYTSIILFPGWILSLVSASEDFNVHYFAYSKEIMQAACFRLEPAFIHFIADLPCYTHSDHSAIKATTRTFETGWDIYLDKENQFRNSIAQFTIQIFFMNIYDKVHRYFTWEQLKGSSRKEQIFKKFIRLVHKHCNEQRDVTFYAEQLCISTRYLSAVSQEITNQSTKEIIDRFLMLEIKTTLQTTNLSLKEIAERYYFPDQSFFGRFFKKHEGVSPKEYRSRIL